MNKALWRRSQPAEVIALSTLVSLDTGREKQRRLFAMPDILVV